MAEARDVRDHLIALGYRVETVPGEVCLWDEAALTAFAEPFAGDLLGAIHPAPPRILDGLPDLPGV